MPGIIGKIKLGHINGRSLGGEQQYVEENTKYKTLPGNRCRYFLAKNTRKSGLYRKGNIAVIYEGILLNQKNTGDKAAENLLRNYKNEGENFVKNLRGSFQILIVDSREIEDKIYLYSDHTASRQIFYAHNEESLIISPDIDQIIAQLTHRTIDDMAMVNFMISGHFPAGHTAINEIKVLGPGEYLFVHEGKIQKKRYYEFKIEPDERIQDNDASKALDTVMKERIIEHWNHADDPAILLSGGYDSQYIFYTICEAVENTNEITTVTWGQNPEKRYADMEIARQTAKRFKTNHIEIIKKLDIWKSEFDEMFTAQNGMTDSSFYHAHELTVCKKLNKKYGIRSIIRGDECLGYGPDTSCAQNALKTNGLSFPEYVHGLDNWFKPEKKIIDNYSKFMTELVKKYNCASYNSLKDTIDFYERQNMNRNPLNYYKLHYLDVFCPLIDPDVLSVICKLPEKYRNNKKLFKKILERKVGKKLQIADYTNLSNWKKVISESDEIKEFFKQEYKYLPSFCNSKFYITLIEDLSENENKNIKIKIKSKIKPLKKVFFVEDIWNAFVTRRRYANKNMNIPKHIIAIRAAVLSRWNDLWIN